MALKSRFKNQEPGIKNQELRTWNQEYRIRNLYGESTRTLTLNVFILYSLFFILGSCKVNYGFKGITIPPGAKTMSVAMFQNQAQLTAPSEVQLLTQKLRDAVSSQTNLALLRQGGDLLFEEGRITYYGPPATPVAVTNNQAVLNRLEVHVKLNFVNKIDPTKNFTDKEFSAWYDYPATQTLSDVESAALDQINRQLTENIFNAAFNNW